jgi:RNA polymerase sigma-70 factor (ECF subfamily)
MRLKWKDWVYYRPESGIYVAKMSAASISPTHPDDEDLSRPGAFERAYARHRTAMVAVATRVVRDPGTAEEIVQDVFTRLWTAPESYDPARSNLRSYLLMVTRTRAIDRWRTLAVRGGAIERAGRMVDLDRPAEHDAADMVIERERARAAAAAVVALPRSQSEALLLAYAGGMTAREVADLTGIPLGTAKSRLRLGLKRARESLEPQPAV